MSDIISILPDSVANQIAAGEVVDRPASAVKELLENALDAGATRIQLFVKEAGRTLIQVVDNGCGMSDSDARLCFERHATSKIHKSDDLYAIRTMGFRGEALASIAAIAQVELRTRQQGNELGTQVLIDGSAVVDQSPCNCPEGTSIAVKNLFYNVPARRNFLKRDSIELSHIEEIFRRVALVNYQTEYAFYSNGRLLYDLHAGNFAERIVQLFGSNYRERLYPVDEQSDIVEIHGYVTKPEFARKTRGEQYLFVNHRFIKHPGLSTAVERAYNDLIPDRHYPGYFLHLKVDPSRIDINIHPNKTEVRFVDEQPLFTILRAATKKALGQFGLANEMEFDRPEELTVPPAPKGYVPQIPQIHYTPGYNPFESSSGATRTHFKEHSRPGTTDNYIQTDDRWKSFFDLPKETPAAPDTPQDTTPAKLDIDIPATPSTSDNACLQLQGRYIVSTLPSGLLLIDQQAAHERILYERFLQQQQHPAAPQQLLFPVNCQFSPADADIFTELLPDLNRHGFEIGTLSAQVFVVTAVPPSLGDADLQPLFDQMLAEYKNAMLQKYADRTQCLCRSLARQKAVKAGTLLQQAEMQQLVADLFCCSMPGTSPSGKKTMTIIPPEKFFNM